VEYTTISPQESQQIFERLGPYLPACLKKVEPGPYSGYTYSFAEFTGSEPEPVQPALHQDSKLAYISKADDPAEHKIRTVAKDILAEIYQEARRLWRNAAYIAELKEAVGDTPDRWKTYRAERKALDAAYDFLRSPEAANEWQPAVSRLIDAQERTLSAAEEFDRSAISIARVHDKHLYADYVPDEALKYAGYSEGEHWFIGSLGDYSSRRETLSGAIRRLVEAQQEHLAKIQRMSGR
jgi:hypothetical protein